MPHPDEGLIHAWLDGELDPADAARVEVLVANDAAWAAAAAEVRGLIAASARIVGTLDRVPANVIPQAAPHPPARPASRQWMWRAAAVLALMAGSAVVLEHESPVLPAPNAQPMAVAARAETLPAAPAAGSAGARAAAPAAQSFALQKFTRLQPSCFEQREPADSAVRIIRLSAAALADSIRLATLVMHGDTLAAVNGRLTAIRVRCPEP